MAELLTNQWNLLVAEETGADGTKEAGRWRIRAALWPREAGGRDLRGGRPYRPPSFPGGPRRWRDAAPDEDAWRTLLADVEPGRRAGVLLREAAWTSGLTAPWILGEAATVDLQAARGRYLSLLGLAAVPGAPAPPEGPAAWLLPGDGASQPYPVRLGRPHAEPAHSLLVAFARAAAAGRWAPPTAGGPGPAAEETGPGGREEAAPATDPEVLRLEAALLAGTERAERRAAALEREIEEGADAERLREDANLILARLPQIRRGAGRIALEGFEGEPREIELDPKLSAAENAERLYALAARRERAARRLPDVLGQTRARVEALRAGLGTLAASGPSEALWELAGGRPEEPGRKRDGDGSRLPYRRYVSSGGLEIRVGRGAKQNDELTFHHSHTEDISAPRPAGARRPRHPALGPEGRESAPAGPPGGGRGGRGAQRGAAQRHGRGRLDAAEVRSQPPQGAAGRRRARTSADRVRRAQRGAPGPAEAVRLGPRVRTPRAPPPPAPRRAQRTPPRRGRARR